MGGGVCMRIPREVPYPMNRDDKKVQVLFDGGRYQHKFLEGQRPVVALPLNLLVALCGRQLQ